MCVHLCWLLLLSLQQKLHTRRVCAHTVPNCKRKHKCVCCSKGVRQSCCVVIATRSTCTQPTTLSLLLHSPCCCLTSNISKTAAAATTSERELLLQHTQEKKRQPPRFSKRARNGERETTVDLGPDRQKVCSAVYGYYTHVCVCVTASSSSRAAEAAHFDHTFNVVCM